MYSYTLLQWLFFFYFYCFAGWCFESAYVSLKSRHPVNRGFMRGPFLPLYGSGAIMMLLVSMPFQDNLVLVYVAGCVGATALEYVTGVVMEALFKVRYWDYSNNPLNFQGHICLGSSLAWGFLTILMTEFIHKPVEHLVLSIPGTVLTAATCLLTAVIGADFALSFKAALDLRDVLVKMEKVREEFIHIRKRLDVIAAVTGEEFADGLNTRMEDLKAGIEDRLERIRSMALTETEKSAAAFAAVREEVQELRAKYFKNVEEGTRLSVLRDFFQRDLIRSNPTMSSRRFQEALEELKKNFDRKNSDHSDREES